MKTLAAALMMSAGLLSASAYAGSNIEPNDTPFVAQTAVRKDVLAAD